MAMDPLAVSLMSGLHPDDAGPDMAAPEWFSEQEPVPIEEGRTVAPEVVRYVPRQALWEVERQQQANEWAMNTRGRLAQTWADVHLEDLNRQATELIQGHADYTDGPVGPMLTPQSPARRPGDNTVMRAQDPGVLRSWEPGVTDPLTALRNFAANQAPEAQLGQPIMNALGEVGNTVANVTHAAFQATGGGDSFADEAAQMIGPGLPGKAGGKLKKLSELVAGGPDALPEGARAIEMAIPDEIERLRLDKFPEGVRDVIASAAEAAGFARGQRRGVIPDAVAEDLAHATNKSLEQWIVGGKAGKTYNTEETRALRNAVTAQAEKVDNATRSLAEAQAAGTATDQMILGAEAETEMLRALTSVAEGARAEAGRSLRAYQALTRSVEANPTEAIARIVQKYGSREKALDAITQYQGLVDSGADVLQRAQFWSKVDKAPVNAADWFSTLRYNSMLSGPRTFEVNFLGNALEMPWRLGRDVAASTLRGRPDEITGEVKGALNGLGKGLEAALDTWRYGITKEQAAQGALPQGMAGRIDNPVGKVAATVLEVPGRIMQAGDAFAMQVAYGMAAGREAAKIGGEIGDLSPQAMKRAADVANRMVYKGEMGTIGRALEPIANIPVVGNIVMPFLRTVYHITARGIDRSPIGAIGTGIDLARGVYKPGKELPKGVAPLGERAVDNAAGVLSGLWLTGLGLNGGLTASGPENTERRRMLEAQGWQPYSIKIGNDWVSYANWGPMAVPLSQAAALAESEVYKERDGTTAEQAIDAAERFGKLATEQSYLSGVGAIARALEEPESYGPSWLTQFLGSLVPFGSAINTVAQAGESEGARRPEKFTFDNPGENIGQGLAMRFPGLRDTVPLNQDVLGRTVPEKMAGGAAFLPLRSSEIDPEPVLAEMERLQQAGKKVGIGRLTDEIKGVELTGAEQRSLQAVYGEMVQQVIGQIIENPGYASAPDGVKAKLIERLDEKLRSMARMRFLGSMEPGDREKRLREAIGKRALELVA